MAFNGTIRFRAEIISPVVDWEEGQQKWLAGCLWGRQKHDEVQSGMSFSRTKCGEVPTRANYDAFSQ